MINQETIQRIVDATRIEEIIGQFVSLKRRGSNYVGCCPFHDEKTPSFSVSPSKGIFKCFGCGKSGNAVGFLMEHEHYTYPEALRWLADKYHIEIEEEKLSEEQVERKNERDALFHVSDFAQKYFASLLYENEMGTAIGLSYFHNRGLTDKVIKDFGLGYCLEQWDNFTKYARSQGYSDNVLQKTGLTIFKDDGKCYDRFRGRVMFPIYSISGRVLGFSGRVLSKEKQAAKYVNSPDSEIYNKSHILYGLYQAKNAISRQDKCYLVEGNIDVISMYQSGVENTVASCGTSLTIEQVRLMRRYTKNVTVLYDGDSAGIKAAFRAVNMLFEEGMHVRVVLFPDGDDPDSYAQKYGSTQLQNYLKDNEKNFVEFKTKVLVDDINNDPIKKAEALREIVRTIALVPDLMERSEYVKSCSSLLRVSEQTLQTELAKELGRRLREGSVHKPNPIDKDLKETEISEGERNNGDGNAENGERKSLEESAEKRITEGSAENGEQRKVTPFIINPAEYQEHKIISLLLNYGNNKLAYYNKDEQGRDVKEELSVAQAIVADILNDSIVFENPLYQKIFNIYAEQLQGGAEVVDELLVTQNEDSEIRDLAISMMMVDYHISDNWRKKQINVPMPHERLKEDVEESLLILKQKKLEQRINNIDRQLEFLPNDESHKEEILMLISQKMSMWKLQEQIGQRLSRVIL